MDEGIGRRERNEQGDAGEQEGWAREWRGASVGMVREMIKMCSGLQNLDTKNLHR